MVSFDLIMRLATDEATLKVSHRLKDEPIESTFTDDLDPEMQQLIKENRINLIVMQEMIKAALKHYHQEVERETQRQIRTRM
jgi:hypothetical protein